LHKLRCDIEKARERVKEFALENPFLPPSKVLTEVQREFDPDILQSLPQNETVYRSIRKWRRPVGVKEPATRSDINLTESLPFVKETEIELAFHMIRTSCIYTGDLKVELDTFVDYVKRTYVGSMYDPPMFPRYWPIDISYDL